MPSASPVLQFTHLLMRNWRNFLKADVSLGRRTFLTGPSGAGKTNFLDSLRFLSELAEPGGGFQAAVSRRGGVRRLRCLAARQESDLILAVRAGVEGDPALWEYELHFNQEGQNAPAVTRERLTRGGDDLVSRPDEADRSDPERLAWTSLDLGGTSREIREFAGFLRTIRYCAPLPALIRERNQLAAGPFEPFGADLLDRIAATTDKTRQARLRHILEALHEAVPQLDQLESYRDSHGRPHLRALHEQWRPRGAWLDEDHLADGTLRLIALLWYAMDGAGPLLVEEPEMSLHPQAVRLVPRMLARLARRSGRQLLVTTHSLDLLCGQGVENGEVLLLNPSEGQTVVRQTLDLKEAAELLDAGTLGTVPASEEAIEADRQLGLF